MPDRLIRLINGPRGSILLACATLAIVHSLAYLDSSRALSTGLAAVNDRIPAALAAAMWAVTAAVAGRGAFVNRRTHLQHDRADAWGFTLIASLLSAWGMTYFLGFIFEDSRTESIFYGAIYWCVAIMAASSARMTNKRRRVRSPKIHPRGAR